MTGLFKRSYIMSRVLTFVFLLSLTLGSTNIFAAKVKPKKPGKKPLVSDVSRKLDLMIDVVDHILSRGWPDVDNLCGPDELMSQEYVYSTECCARNEDGECTGTRQTRRKKGICVRRDDSGAIFDSYESYGVTEYGDCVDVSVESPPQTVTPF